MKNTQSALIVALVFLLLIIGCGKPNETVTNNQPANNRAVANAASPDAASPEAAPSEEKSSGVTMEKFSKVKSGMTYKQVVEVFGAEGEVLSESEMSGIRTVMYKWAGAEMLSSVTVMFQNDKMIQKSQFGLK